MGCKDDSWRSTTLGEIITLNYGKSLPKRKRNPGKIPVYGSNGITGYHELALVSGPGIIVGRKGTSGAVHYCKIDYFPIDTTFYITPSNDYNLRYVYYLLQTLNLSNLNFDSAVPGLNRSVAYSIPVKIPQKDEQKRIASILGALDDKIELNHQMNHTLEEMAQAIFKSSFVDFEPFKDGEFEYNEELGKKIPKGWEVKSVYSLADYINGMAFRMSDFSKEGLPIIKIAELNNGITNNTKLYNSKYKEKYFLRNGDILFSWSASLSIYLWDGGDAILNQHIFNVKPKGTMTKPILYFLLKEIVNEFIQIAAFRATTMGHIKKGHLQERKIAIPDEKSVKILNDKLEPLFSSILANKLETHSLAQIRDALLPKLLSEDIRVKVDKREAQQ